MRWVDASNVGGSHTQYERPQPTCDNCGYMEYYLGWDDWDGEYGKKKKNFYPKLEKNEDTGKWDFKKWIRVENWPNLRGNSDIQSIPESLQIIF